ncbi:DUF411 domain-containing protein [Natronobacterium gregoryi]|uniref:Metal-binding protein n=2 Tax=Natronobacterium gregoryi TaxID=44930 RepID=L0AK48_NATGS|nr:DUF411 domain-containing protein [Natronobacterium gregoryi]AFZ74263.1 putative metal-binding protein [Natronobacterium gregoryi SP2]ELY63721.1 hypothetical protein C490_15764 [Natronobacterium gregoryi SP2]PLK21954.1 hypothetical protein CYV19_00710 [Natronobacterium gregoryi SP2]SFI52596.1 Uncharacterized conserved protein [Natronobacterium gregoryi]
MLPAEPGGMREPVSRRRFCVTGAGTMLASVGLAGCLEETDTETEPTSSDSGSEPTHWDWDGSLPLESGVQYHDPNCGCCGEYVDYLDGHGLDIRVEHVDDLGTVKTELGVPADVRSCHTLVLGEDEPVLVEGHVPLEAVELFLADEPSARGLAAPGMPQHSPGMGPRGDEPLRIYAFDEDGAEEYTTV